MIDQPTLEDRVGQLEGKVERLLQLSEGKQRDWRRTLGMFAGDESMKEIDKAGAHIREQDRRETIHESDQE